GDKKTKVIVETKKGKPLEDPEHEYLVTSETDVDEDGHIDFFALGHPGLGIYGGVVGVLLFSTERPNTYCEFGDDVRLTSPIRYQKVAGKNWKMLSRDYTTSGNPICPIKTFYAFTENAKNIWQSESMSRVSYYLRKKDSNFINLEGLPNFTKFDYCDIAQWLEEEPKNIEKLCDPNIIGKAKDDLDKNRNDLNDADISQLSHFLALNDACLALLTNNPQFEGFINYDNLNSGDFPLSDEEILKIEKKAGRYYFRSKFRSHISQANFENLSPPDKIDQEFIKSVIKSNFHQDNEKAERELKNFILNLPATYFLDDQFIEFSFLNRFKSDSCLVDFISGPLVDEQAEKLVTKILSARGIKNTREHSLKLINDFSLVTSRRAYCTFKKWPDPTNNDRKQSLSM
ncbi:MAG: hypothetical protein ACXVCP_19485, partial [Bdellovibrio sp.]